MNIPEFIAGALLAVACLVIILVVLIQDSKDQGMSSAITGSTNDSFFGKNGRKTKETKIATFTKISAFIFFAVTLAVNIISVHMK